jgi:hypothetical protein
LSLSSERGNRPQFLSKRDCEAVNNAVLDRPKQEEEKDEPVVQEDLISRKSLFSILGWNGGGHSSSHSSRLLVDI